MKVFRRLDVGTVREGFKVRIYAMMSVITYQAQPLVTGSRNAVMKVSVT